MGAVRIHTELHRVIDLLRHMHKVCKIEGGIDRTFRRLCDDVDNGRVIVYIWEEQYTAVAFIAFTVDEGYIFIRHLAALKPWTGVRLLREVEAATAHVSTGAVRGIAINPKLVKAAQRFGYGVAGVLLEKRCAQNSGNRLSDGK